MPRQRMVQPETTKVTRIATPAFDALGLLVAALFGGILAYSYVAGRRGFLLTLLFAARARAVARKPEEPCSCP